MSEVKLAATARTEFGKGAARRIRRANQIPAVIYGHGSDPLHITLPGHQTMLALKHANALFQIDLDGGESRLAIAKDVQRDPVKNVIEHVDLLEVRRGERVTIELQVHLVGEPAPGSIAVTETQTLSVEVEATQMPEAVEVSIEGLEAGTQVRASEVQLPEGTTLLSDGDTVVVSVAEPRGTAEDEAEEAAAEEAAAEEAAAEDAAESGEGASEGSEASEES